MEAPRPFKVHAVSPFFRTAKRRKLVAKHAKHAKHAKPAPPKEVRWDDDGDVNYEQGLGLMSLFGEL